MTLFVAEALDFLRHPRWRHMQQDVGAIYPMDVGLHGVKAMRGDVLKTEILLDIFMKKLHRPAKAISQHDLARCDSEITTG